MRRNKKIRLLAEAKTEKVWAALSCVQGLRNSEWVPIDVLGDFLKMRQIDARESGHKTTDPATRYALPRSVLKPSSGWTDHDIVSALQDAVDKGLVLHARRADGNYFQSMKKEDHGMWSVRNDGVPTDPRWGAQLKEVSLGTANPG